MSFIDRVRANDFVAVPQENRTECGFCDEGVITIIRNNLDKRHVKCPYCNGTGLA